MWRPAADGRDGWRRPGRFTVGGRADHRQAVARERREGPCDLGPAARSRLAARSYLDSTPTIVPVAVASADRLSHRAIAAVMGFGGGVLIAVLSVDLMETAFRGGGPTAATFGLLSGATAFCVIDWRLSLHGARHRNRCGGCVAQPSEAEHQGSGLAIAAAPSSMACRSPS